ncbi:hypothetical protein BLS_001218 [Venturia inaequalis]|uniref:Extracellular membrane protein CFEM domain-containing protein n=1 Tax=Venturia inaequalis TaxID=5025 RepID=A0A8H3ZAA6_VENIN|nr:hypothetical protein BLS_001218 [Venturia inaequalis]KAE9965805.1 hypothetical protein EG328_009392 [Venturia inaequalis]KAE9991509.1 hypothetical protein EG327_011529 [Venturia inaequalis]RDI86567.1 hypothetical protein Vi05172_g3400 [Venturia inaequalis]
MRYSTIFTLVIAFATSSLSMGLSDGDVPAICKSVCRPLIQLSSTCASSSSGGLTSAESDCICKNTSFNVKEIGSNCAICITQSNAGSPDLTSVSSACGFTNAAYNQASASSLAAKVTVTATKSGNSVVTLNPTAVVASTGAVATTSSHGAAPTGMKVGKAGLVGTALEVALAMMLLC